MHYSESKYQLFRLLSVTLVVLFAAAILLVPARFIPGNASFDVPMTIEVISTALVMVILGAGYLLAFGFSYYNWLKIARVRTSVRGLYAASMLLTHNGYTDTVRIPRQSGGVLVVQPNMGVFHIEDLPTASRTPQSFSLSKRGIVNLEHPELSINLGYLKAMEVNIIGFSAKLEDTPDKPVTEQRPSFIRDLLPMGRMPRRWF